MGKYDKAIVNALCKLESATSGNVDSLDEITDLLTQILDLPQIEGLSPIRYCDASGNTTGFVAYILDEETNTPSPVYFDAAGLPSDTAPTGSVCDSADSEFKFFEKEKCLGEEKITEVLCIYYINGTQESTSTFWIVDGLQVLTDPGATACVESEIQVIRVPQCYVDCTTGYALIKVDVVLDTVELLGSFTLSHVTTDLEVVECPEIKILKEENNCEL